MQKRRKVRQELDNGKLERKPRVDKGECSKKREVMIVIAYNIFSIAITVSVFVGLLHGQRCTKKVAFAVVESLIKVINDWTTGNDSE